MPTIRSGLPNLAELENPDLVRASFRVSAGSAGWTLITSAAAVTFGVISGSAVLVALGSIGFVDAVGSAALAFHFLLVSDTNVSRSAENSSPTERYRLVSSLSVWRARQERATACSRGRSPRRPWPERWWRRCLCSRWLRWRPASVRLALALTAEALLAIVTSRRSVQFRRALHWLESRSRAGSARAGPMLVPPSPLGSSRCWLEPSHGKHPRRTRDIGRQPGSAPETSCSSRLV